MNLIRLVLAAASVALVVGCQQAKVTHVVVCWLKEPGNEAARQQIIDASNSFKAIPGVVEVTAGPSLPSTRPVVDTSYDIAIVMRLRDEQALKDYGSHPMHIDARNKTFLPLVQRFVIYDFAE
jgi:hypothetical protein